MTKTVTFRLTGRHCGGCAASTGTHCRGCAEDIEQAFSKLPGVINLDINLPGRRATIAFDPAVFGEKEMMAAAEQSGFRVDTWG